jgi:hypothetical protein
LVCKACTEDKQYAAKLGNDAQRQITKTFNIVHLGICPPKENMYVGGLEFERIKEFRTFIKTQLEHEIKAF